MTCRRILPGVLVLSLCLLTSGHAGGQGRHGEIFGPNVLVFGPESPGIQETISAIYSVQMQKAKEFSDRRYAILFKPGHYHLDVRVGYYTQVAGLGRSPDDVTITGAVRTQDNPATKPVNEGPGALDNFWRSAENLSVVPTLGSLTLGPPSSTPDVPGGIPLNQNVWAVSQAAPLRRIHIKASPIMLSETECANANFFAPERKRVDPLIRTCPTTLRLFDVGWSSGGFMADSRIDGLVESGSQQQWVSRNTTWTQWNTENWNMVFVGSLPVPKGVWPGTPDSDGAITDGGPTPVIRGKPFLIVDRRGHFFVKVPDLRRASDGVDWDAAGSPGIEIPINRFHIVKPISARRPWHIDAAGINSALERGQHLLITPGVYFVDGTIEIERAGTVVLGLGAATLVANDGKAIMKVADVSGVTISGLIFEAGSKKSTTLLEVGEPGSGADHAADPALLHDIFCRVGGGRPGRVASCVTINSNNVIGDNLWLWRADHGPYVGWTINTADTGLIVNGANVVVYGLAVEHFQQYQTVWNGNAGRVYFYQSETPYDVPSQAEWMNGAVKGYASYKVGDAVTDHAGWGLGVYSFFRDAVASLESAIEVPAGVEAGLTNMVTFWLNGQEGSEITHILNDLGAAVTKANRKATLPE
jgi:hypothetical protein